MRPLHVVYIAGCARSGSTILDIALGNHSTVESVGELKELARLRWPENGYCSCRQRVRECAFWSRVHEDWMQDLDSPELGSYVEMVHLFLSLKKWHRWKSTLRTASPALRLFRRQTLGLYRSIQRVSGKNVIVDSSKGPGLAYFLSSLPEVKLSVIHLVRDPRGVSWSFMKSFQRDERAGLERRLSRTPAWKATARWRVVNALTEWALRHAPGVQSIVVRYEDFTHAPAKELDRIGRFLGADFAALGERVAAGTALEIGHKIGGSRIRMQSRLALEPADEAWKASLPASTASLVRLLAGARFSRYGYTAASGAGG